MIKYKKRTLRLKTKVINYAFFTLSIMIKCKQKSTPDANLPIVKKYAAYYPKNVVVMLNNFLMKELHITFQESDRIRMTVRKMTSRRFKPMHISIKL